jgi:choline-sulfatase
LQRVTESGVAQIDFCQLHLAFKRAGPEKRTGQLRRLTILVQIGQIFSHPHDTRNGTPELLAKYGAVNHADKSSLPPANPKQPELPPNYLPAHPFPDGHPNLRDEVAVSGVWNNRDERTIRNEIGRECACAENSDIQIGKVLAKLKAMGELENTYIIYAADHGMAIDRHGLQGKQNLYEHTWRVPYLVTGPGIKVGSRGRPFLQGAGKQ